VTLQKFGQKSGQKFGQGSGGGIMGATMGSTQLGPQPRPRPSHTGKQIASIKYLPNGLMMQVETGYHKEFLGTLKRSITAKKRLYDGQDKCWYVTNDQYDKLVHILEQYFDDVVLIDFPALDVATDSWGKLHLAPGAPMEVVRAVYKALSLLHHPDKGGDEERMSEVNVAYKEIMGKFVNGD